MKILIIKFRNIGDVLLTGPLISTLKQSHPDSHISVLVKAGTEAMLQHHPHVDEVMVVPSRRNGESKLRFIFRELKFVMQLRAMKFDTVINTTEGDHGTLIAYFANIKQRIGAAKGDRDKKWRRNLLTDARDMLPGRRHTVMRNLELLPDLGLDSYRNIELGFTAEDKHYVQQKLQQLGWERDQTLVQVHPTSRWFFKCWQDQAFAEVIDHLQQNDKIGVVLTSGPEEKEREKIANIIERCKTKPLDLGGQLSLTQTAALSSLCKLFVGVDTAPMHMAAAVNTPVIALFGPSGTFDWGPWPNGWQGDNTPYSSQNGIQDSGPHTVIQKNWPCAPCGQDGCDGSKRSRCLDELTSDEVIPIIDQKLAELSLGSTGKA